MVQTSSNPSRKRTPYASPAAALTFGRYSRAADNTTLRDRRDVDNGCDCQSYVDILTRGRWRALDYHIRHTSRREPPREPLTVVELRHVESEYIPSYWRCAAADADGWIRWESAAWNFEPMEGQRNLL